MQIRIDNTQNPNFGMAKMVKMKAGDRERATQLIKSYIDNPSLKVRDEIFDIFDPYMQRHAKDIAGEDYYYDDVLQNMRLNLFTLLDDEHSQKVLSERLLEQINVMRRKLKKNRIGLPELQEQYEKLSSSLIQSAKEFKFKLVHGMEHTTDAKIPQRDESLVPWRSLPHTKQEKLIPPNRLEKENLAEEVDFYLDTSWITPVQRDILNLLREGNSIGDISDIYYTTPACINTVLEKGIKRIRNQHGIEPKNTDKAQKHFNVVS